MTSKQLLDAAKILRLSAETIKAGGWTTGVMYREDLGHCAVGAIGLAATGAEIDHVPPVCDQLDARTLGAVTALVDFLHEKPGPWNFEDVEYEMDVREWPLDAVMVWNDEHVGGRDRVVEAMTEAAAWTEQRAAAGA
jgi:hypothetical protein